MNAVTIGWSPSLPWSVIAAFAALALLVFAVAAFRRPAGLVWRAAAAMGILIALADPSLIVEERAPVGDIALLLVDHSASTRIGDRQAQARDIVAALETQIGQHEGLELRVVPVGADSRPETYDGGPDFASRDGTHMFTALAKAMTDIPRRRFAGAIMVTDGQIHDAPEPSSTGQELADSDLGGPLHAIILGQRDASDRRIEIVQAPSFGMVGEPARISFRVDVTGPISTKTAMVTVRRGTDQEIARVPANIGAEASVDVELEHGSTNIFSLEVAAGDEELTLTNNRAVVVVNGIRDRLKVLLVSGQPHPGERTWRNLLKSDPGVDLVHFTILRPPNKQDRTPVNELSLIAFPVRELFEIKLNDFDLIIFDNYQRRGALPQYYLNNIADYVLEGGALLEAAGPSFTLETSLAGTPLSRVLPAQPTGTVFEQGYRAAITAEGARHPVTAGLTGGPVLGTGGSVVEEASWGRWFRQIDAGPSGGTVVLEGVSSRPLLLLDRVGDGRVAQFMTDQIWLWARGYEGGGPHSELLRRLAHWLMKEPQLEEDVLGAEERGGSLEITRRSLSPESQPVRIIFPSGRSRSVTLEEGSDGIATGQIEIDEAGIYRLEDGKRVALAAVGTLNPLEFSDVAATDALVADPVEASGGAIVWQDGRRRAQRAPHGGRPATMGPRRCRQHAMDWPQGQSGLSCHRRGPDFALASRCTAHLRAARPVDCLAARRPIEGRNSSK